MGLRVGKFRARLHHSHPIDKFVLFPRTRSLLQKAKLSQLAEARKLDDREKKEENVKRQCLGIENQVITREETIDCYRSDILFSYL